MPENNIRNISISATGDTQKAEDALNKLIIKLKTIKDLVGAGLSFNAKGFENVATAMKSIKDAKVSKSTVNNISDLAAAISKFRSAAIQTQTSDSVKQMAASLSAIQMTKISKKVIDQLPQLGIALSFFARQFTDADVQRLVQLSVALQYLSGVNLQGIGGIGGLAQQMKALMQAQNSGVTQTVQQTKQISTLGSAASHTASVIAFLVKGIFKLTFALTGGLFIAISKVTVALSKMAFNIALFPFKKLALHVRDVTKKLAGFLAAIKRIAVYRAIRTALKEISQGFREGMENLYQYSLLMNGTFAQSMDTIATSALYAKDSLAAMAAPIINVLAPAIDFLVDKFVDALNTVNELIASLTGATTWTRALKYPKAYAEALDGANGRAKELRATLLGFDEINRLDDNKKGSRGSAADELDYSQLFTEETVSSNAKGIIDRLKEAFLSGDFSGIGSALGEKLREALSNIPWESIKDRFKKNAMSAATFINGIIDTEGLPDELGHAIAEAFNTVTGKISTFFGTVKWDKVGKFVGDTLSKAVEDIDKAQLGQAIKDILSAALDVAWGLIEADPLIGGVALTLIGLRFGKLLGTGMGSGVAASGLGSTIKSLIPTAATIGITAAVSWKVGNYLYDNVQWIQDVADWLVEGVGEFGKTLAEGWGRFWDTDAYHDVAHFWAKVNGFADTYQEKTLLWESQRQWLMKQGYTENESYEVLMAKYRLDQINDEEEVLEALGLQRGEMVKIFEKMKATKNLTDEEMEALNKLIIKDWEIRFETKFGKTPQEMAQEWMDNLKTKLQPVADALKKAGNDWGTAIKNGLLEIFSGDGIKNQIKKCLPTSMSLNVTVTGSTSNSANYVKGFASGGDPATGTLFIAGERGAELVSSTGRGTNVSNQNQIAASVAEGMEYANEEQNALLREQNALLRELVSKEFTSVAQITTGQIREALDRDNKRAGTTLVAVN